MSEPLFRIVPGAQAAFTRSGWGPDDTLVTFGPHVLWGSHGDRSAGSFLVFRSDWLAAKAGLLTASGIAQDAIDSNTITCDGQPQTFGQKAARITVQENNDFYTYLAADLAPAYVGQLLVYQRELLFLKPNYLLIRDTFTPVNPASVCTWHLHTLTKPALLGNGFTAGRLGGAFVSGGLPSVQTITKSAGQTPTYRIDLPMSGHGLVALEAEAAVQIVSGLGQTINAAGVQGIACGSSFVAWLTGPGPWRYLSPGPGKHWLVVPTPAGQYSVINGTPAPVTPAGILAITILSPAGALITITQQGGPPVSITFGGYRDGSRNPVTSILAGQTLLIQGAGFGATPGTVNFAGSPASINGWSDTQINVTVPNLGSGALSAPPVVNGAADPYPLTVVPVTIPVPPPPPPGGTFTVSGVVTRQSDGTLTGNLTLVPR